MVRCLEIAIATDGSGAATVESHQINGTILEIRNPGTSLNEEAKADVTITRAVDGAQILKATNKDGPWSAAPRQPTVTNENAAALYAAGGAAVLEEIPVAGYLNVVVAQAKANASGSILVYYEE